MSEPTPGPWIVGAHFAERLGGRTYIPVLRPGNDPVPIAVVHRDVDGYGRAEGEANARLIAAARTVLAALAKLVNPDDFDKHPQDFTPEWHEAREAIRSASPKQPGAK